MSHVKSLVLPLALAGALTAGTAEAGDWSNSATYNGAATSQNAASNFSLRDANGNLTVVDGQFTSATTSLAGGVAASGVGGVGMGGSAGVATAIGNSLNVVTVGNNNTVVVNSAQTNSGSQTATANLSGH